VVKKSDRVTYHDMCTIKDFVSCRLAVSSNFLFTGINNRGKSRVELESGPWSARVSKHSKLIKTTDAIFPILPRVSKK
jgi:hypothetical protein